MKFPLRITVTTAFGLFTVVAVAAVAALNFAGNRSAILETAHGNIATAAMAAERGVDELVGKAVLTADTVALLPKPIFDWRDPEALLVTLAVSLRSSPQIYGVFVGFPDGAFVQAVNLIGPDGKRRDVAGMPARAATAWRVIGPAAGDAGRPQHWRYFDAGGAEIALDGTDTGTSAYDPRTRAWYHAARDKDGAAVSKVYVFSSLKKPGVTVSTPVRGQPGHVVGVDLSLDDLARLAADLSPGKGGVVAIVDGDGGMVAHPEPARIVRPAADGDTVHLVPVAEIDDGRVRRAAEPGMADGALHAFLVDGAEYIGVFHRTAATGAANWNVVSVAATADYTGGLVATLQQSLLFAGTVLVIVLWGVAAMAGWITEPIIRLRGIADRIAHFNFSDEVTPDTPFEEINRLQQSMQQMKGALDTFLRFVPRDVVRELVGSGQAATVGGTRREVTMLFTDVENFTSMTERMTPEEIMSQASEYFENLSFGIQANRGTIDKYIGDAIMAMWNAPSTDEAHAANACRGTLAAYHISEDLNAEFTAKGLMPMRTRFGLHTGEVLVGNVGARDRMQYTCLGSSVNLAARIEGLNKFYGTQVLASDAVRRRAGPAFLFRRVDIVEAKGTSLPVTVYELMGERGEDAAFYVGPDVLHRASKYEQAFDFYLHRDFDDALAILEALGAEQPDDPVVALLTRKCRSFKASPPPDGWNGATALDKK